MLDTVKLISEKAVNSVKNIREDPINNLAYLLVIAMALTAIVSGTVSYIMFVTQDGYSKQIELLKNDGFDGISAGFTSGTVRIIISGITSKIMCGLVVAEFVVMMINYFKNNSKVKKIIMIVDLVFCAIVIALTTALFGISVGKFVITEQYVDKYYDIFDSMTIYFNVIVNIYLVVAAISFVTYLVLILSTRECQWMVGYTSLALLFSNIVVPLFLLVLENIIPLITGAVALFVVGVLIFVGFKILLSVGDSNDIPYTSSGGNNYSAQGEAVRETNYSAQKEVVRENNVETNQSNQKEIKDWSGPFWRDEGGYGVFVPQADCIYGKNLWGEKTFVCTVYEFETGKVAIIDSKTNCRVMNIAGCETPEK